MSVSILEVIEAGGYNLSEEEDARWLLAQVNQFEELVTKAEDMVEEIEQTESDRIEREYQEKFN